jgi:hypothetical protein
MCELAQRNVAASSASAYGDFQAGARKPTFVADTAVSRIALL